MYKGSSTSFVYVEKVENQVPRCGMRGGEAEGSHARRRAVVAAVEEEASVEVAAEEIDVNDDRGDRRRAAA
jgi:hypothetical protein